MRCSVRSRNSIVIASPAPSDLKMPRDHKEELIDLHILSDQRKPQAPPNNAEDQMDNLSNENPEMIVPSEKQRSFGQTTPRYLEHDDNKARNNEELQPAIQHDDTRFQKRTSLVVQQRLE